MHLAGNQGDQRKRLIPLTLSVRVVYICPRGATNTIPAVWPSIKEDAIKKLHTLFENNPEPTSVQIGIWAEVLEADAKDISVWIRYKRPTPALDVSKQCISKFLSTLHAYMRYVPRVTTRKARMKTDYSIYRRLNRQPHQSHSIALYRRRPPYRMYSHQYHQYHPYTPRLYTMHQDQPKEESGQHH